MITREQFEEIMGGGDTKYGKTWEGCRIFAGLKIITKYLPKMGIEAAEHDIIYSTDIDSLIAAGITEEEVMKLKELHWMIDEFEEGLAHSV